MKGEILYEGSLLPAQTDPINQAVVNWRLQTERREKPGRTRKTGDGPPRVQPLERIRAGVVVLASEIRERAEAVLSLPISKTS